MRIAVITTLIIMMATVVIQARIAPSADSWQFHGLSHRLRRLLIAVVRLSF